MTTTQTTQTRRALILVDIQPTFCEGGELAVEGGNRVAQDAANFVLANRDTYDLIVTTQDWHIDPGAHFSHNPDFIDSWPPHGVAGTANADIHPTLTAALTSIGGADITILKGQFAAAYSAFDGHDATGDDLITLLNAKDIEAIDVCGLAESHCVKDTVLDALAAGFATELLSDLTAPVSEELGVAARSAMTAAGATTRTTR